MPSNCASRVELEALLKGTLPAAESAGIDQHLLHCAACRQKLSALADGNESWLKAKQAGSGNPISSPPLREAMNRLKVGDKMPPCEKPGDRIGRYKLLEQIGEGGCGVVYVAEQEEPVRRRVALKVIKLGMDTKQVIARFDAERQALAMMDHPNIAKIFDAGITDAPATRSAGFQPAVSPISNRQTPEKPESLENADALQAGSPAIQQTGSLRYEALSPGRPYFVMELVRGIKITDYCDQNQLSPLERLDLFTQVCRAIQHAHQKGIIHRDIKPSNILVTLHDGVPVPKVIDFGIAKATQGRLTDQTVYTAFEQFIGTPAYMSPEQAEMSGLDIDTRSDIYSLGVLLYELLTGKTPFDAKELLTAALDEMRRTIREKEPARPSTRLSTMLEGELTTTARHRHTDAVKLIHQLRGDLDWIVMKCLEKDRTRRYETANSLASDIERHRNNEPVVARPPSRLYRFQKLVRRNKLAFAAGSAVAASLVVGLTLSTVLFFRERAARERASEEGARAREQAAIAQSVNDFLQEDLLLQADSRFQAEAQFTPDPNLTVREALERAAERIGDRFKDRPLQEAAVRMAMGNAFRGVGEVEPGIAHLHQALDLRREKLGPDHPDTLRSMRSLLWAYQTAGKTDQALPLAEETLKFRKARLGPDHRDTLLSMNDLARTYGSAGKHDQALLLLEHTLKVGKAKLGPDDSLTLQSMHYLAVAYQEAGKLDQALPLAEETLKLRKAKLGPDHPDTLFSMDDLANAYSAAGKVNQALPLAEETLKLSKARLGPDHPNTLRAMNDLANVYHTAGKLDQALPLYEETLRLQKAKQGYDHTATLWTMNNLAVAYGRAGKSDQALPLLEETVKLGKAKLGTDHPDLLEWTRSLGVAFWANGKLDQALPLLEETLKLMEARDHRSTRNAREVLTSAYQAAGKRDKALALAGETLNLSKARLGPDHPRTLAAMNELANSYRQAGKLDEALPLFRAAAEKDNVEALNDLAWLLGTCSNDAMRDGRSAVGYAERAVAKEGRKSWGTLDTLAAAYAEAGEFAKAAEVQREAIGLCRDEKIKNDLIARLKLYESNTPYREP